MRNLFLTYLFILTLCLQACGNQPSQSPAQPEVHPPSPAEKPLVGKEAPQEAPQEAPVTAQRVSDGKTRITGIVRYEGEIPKLREIKMDGDPICLMKHKGEAVFPETLVLGEGKTMGNIFVHIKGGLPNQAHPAPSEEIVITQEGCMYAPHVVGVMIGQAVKFLNPDGTLHNIHSGSKINKEFNIAMPKFRTELTMQFDKEEFMFPLKCDVHPWMGAWISVLKHPYFETTGKDGRYSLEGLPAGTYVLEAWHERLGTQEKTIVISEGETQEVNFTFSKPK